jgi:hypothetical protein
MNQFQDTVDRLCSEHTNGSSIYRNSKDSFKGVVTTHFRNVKRKNKYGVYLIRQQSTGELLYIGKGGTITNNGQFKSQDIPGRLKAIRGDQNAQEWFGSLVDERGPIVIKYIFFSEINMVPSFIEAVLLQEYLKEFSTLPYRNNAF